MFPNSIIKHQQYSYLVYKAFLKYLYTGTIDLSSLDDELGELNESQIISLSLTIYN